MSILGERVVLAIDPGSSKCGLALVHRNAANGLDLLWRAVKPVEELCDGVQEAMTLRPFTMIIVGSGTHSKEVIHRLREFMPSIGILVVDEKETTVQARERYWEHNPRRGWRRLLPATMQVPPDPVDDFVALILAERVLTES